MIFLYGDTGQLGSIIKAKLQEHHIPFLSANRNTLPLNDLEEMKKYVLSSPIRFVINCAAYTKVDQAEEHKQEAELVNVIGVQNLVELSKEKDAVFIHISTDYVFDGASNRPYTEIDEPNPLSVYGKTKRDGELMALENYDQTIIIRTSWLYSHLSQSFYTTVKTLASTKSNLSIVADQIGTPTSAKDLAEMIVHIIPKINDTHYGIYHYSNEGIASWYDFAYMILNYHDISCKLLPIMTKDYPTKAMRPLYTVLNKEKIKKTFGLEIRHWAESLKEVIMDDLSS